MILVQKYWKIFEMAKIGHSKFFWTILMQKYWKKFEMAKIGHSEFFKTISVAKRLEEIRNRWNQAFQTFRNHFDARQQEEVQKSLRFTSDQRLLLRQLSKSQKWVRNPFVCDVTITIAKVSGNGYIDSNVTNLCDVAIAIAQWERILWIKLTEFHVFSLSAKITIQIPCFSCRGQCQVCRKGRNV